MTFLVDMDLSPEWVAFLQKAGFEAIHSSSLGPAWAEDKIIMAHAKRNGWIVFTHDRDYGVMLAMSKDDRPSVIQLRCDGVLPEDVGDMIVRAIRSVEYELTEGALMSIDPHKTRFRLLPIY